MSKQANTKLIGLFVLGGLALALVAVFLLSAGIFREKVRCLAFFEGSVMGLNVGAPVTFRGVKVGTVTDIQLRVDRKDLNFLIPVFFDVETAQLTVVGEDGRHGDLNVEMLVERGLRAQLKVQSLVTGLLMIELDFKPGTSAIVVGTIEGYPEIPTLPSDLEDFLRRFEEVPIEYMLDQVTEILRTVRGILDSTETRDALRNLGSALDGINLLVRQTGVHVDPLMSEATLAMQEMRVALTELQNRLPALLERLDTTVGAAQGTLTQVDQGLARFVEQFEKTAMSAQELIQRVGAAARDDSALMYNLEELAAEATSAARAIRVLADYLQQHPEALLHGKKP